MSKFTQFLNKPASVTSDIVVAVACGAAAIVVLKAFLPVIPFLGGLADLIAWPLGAVLAAMVYHRARQNLIDPTPPAF